MAQLDSFFSYFQKYHGDEICLQSDAEPTIKISGQAKVMGKQKLSSDQILLLIKEIIPSDALAGLKSRGAAEFVYPSPSGSVKSVVSIHDKFIRAMFSPYHEEVEVTSLETKEETIELEEEVVSKKDVVQKDTKEFQRVDTEDGRTAMEHLFKILVHLGGSDLHLSSGEKPVVRKDGSLVKLNDFDIMTPESLENILLEIAPEKSQKEFKERRDTDFAYEIKDLARFRCNLFMDRKGIGGVFRVIPAKILTVDDLGLGPAIQNLCFLTKGLALVTGPTGSGKSTTLCAMIDLINRKRNDHIITIEDPIEFVHENKSCLINQREVGAHTSSFAMALRAALREDPDIVLVGEMRDLETIAIAIETAETGHLVFGTLHTTTAASTVDRIIEQFPADRQAQIRVMLSESLKGVIAQNLLRKIGGGRVAVMEVLIVTHSVSNLIREGKTFQIPSVMQTGKGQGMVLLNDSLIQLVNDKVVEPKEAYLKAVEKEVFANLLRRYNHDVNFLKELEGLGGTVA
ncbi:MAG: type IV pilus twitching motility protein PilT [Pseudomonadota bacterium]